MILIMSNICILILIALALMVIAEMACTTFITKESWALWVVWVLLLGAVMARVYMSLF